MGPPIHSSPTSPRGSSTPCSSMTTTRAAGSSTPTLSAWPGVSPIGIIVTGDVVSVAP